MINPRFGLTGDAQLFAGETFSVELSFLDNANSPVDLTGRSFALQIFNKNDRTVLESVSGTVVGGSDPYVTFSIGGDATEDLYGSAAGKPLKIEIAELLSSGKDVWIAGNLRMLTSAETTIPASPGTSDGSPISRFTISGTTRRVVLTSRGTPGRDASHELYAAGLLGDPTVAALDARYSAAAAAQATLAASSASAASGSATAAATAATSAAGSATAAAGSIAAASTSATNAAASATASAASASSASGSASAAGTSATSAAGSATAASNQATAAAGSASAAQTSATSAATGASTATTQATAAATSATNAATSSTTAAASRDIVVGLAGITGTFSTYAAANTALASISANAFILVLADETKGGRRSVYQKQSGALVFQTLFSTPVTWYLSNAGSNLANDGLSTATPRATFNAGVKPYLLSGDKILLRCGDTFRETFDLSTFGRVTLDSYGAGLRPVIDGADVVVESWSLVSGNVYRVLITVPDAASAVRAYPGMFENGVSMIEKDIVIDGLSTSAAQVAAVQATPGSFLLESPVVYRDGAAAGATYSYIVQATGGGNPASNGNLYEVRKRQYTIVHAGALISGITFRRQFHHDGASLLYNSTLPGKWTNCVFDQMPRHHTIDSLSDYEDCISLRPNAKYPGSYHFHSYGPAGQGNTKRYKRCKAIGDGVTATSGFGTHSSVAGTPCQARIIYEDCENYGTAGFTGYDFSAGDYIRCRNFDCISDFGVANGGVANKSRLIDCNFTGANGSSACSPPATGSSITLIRTKWLALTSQAFFLTNVNVGSIDIQEGCELLWEAQPWPSSSTAFFCFNGSYTGTSLKVRRSIVGAIGGGKRLFEYSNTTGFGTRDIDSDTIIGGLLAPVSGTQNTMVGALDANLSSAIATLIGTSGIATTALMPNLRKMFTGDPARDGMAKRTGANWPIHNGFNAGAYAPSGGGALIAVGRTIVTMANGYKTGTIKYTPASELFAVTWISASTAIACGANGLIVRSTDYGSTWSVIASGVSTTLRGIAFTGTTVVIVGLGGTILRSTDSGATFAALATPGTTADLYAVTYANSRFAACGSASAAGYSTDGSDTSWTFAVVGSGITFRGIAYGSSVFALVGATATTFGLIYTSATMASGSFTARTPNTQANLVGIASDGTVFAAVGVSGGMVVPELVASADGLTWADQPLDMPFDAAWITAPAVETNRWAIGGRSNYQLFAHDPRGSAWRSEAITPISPAALAATRTGQDGYVRGL